MAHRLAADLVRARRAAGLTQGQLAARAGLSRLTVHRVEHGQIDPRLSTLVEMARALGIELLAVPAALRPELETFVRAGGKLLGQPEGASAPRSIVSVLTDPLGPPEEEDA